MLNPFNFKTISEVTITSVLHKRVQLQMQFTNS